MNTAGVNRIHEFAIIFSVMDELFEEELPSNFDDQLLIGRVLRRLEGRVNPSLIREAIALAQDRLVEKVEVKAPTNTQPVSSDWYGSNRPDLDNRDRI